MLSQLSTCVMALKDEEVAALEAIVQDAFEGFEGD